MKKQITTTIAITILATTLIFSCKKKSDPTPDTPASTTSPSTTTGGTTGAIGSFTWTENGGPVQTADSAFWTSGTWGTGVRASKGGFANYFEINWATQNNTSVNTKTLTVGDFTFLQGPSSYTNPANQTLAVTAFTNNQLSGAFTVAVSGGTITTITGGFTSIKFK